MLRWWALAAALVWLARGLMRLWRVVWWAVRLRRLVWWVVWLKVLVPLWCVGQRRSGPQ